MLKISKAAKAILFIRSERRKQILPTMTMQIIAAALTEEGDGSMKSKKERTVRIVTAAEALLLRSNIFSIKKDRYIARMDICRPEMQSTWTTPAFVYNS